MDRMKRARRAILLTALFLLGGAVVSVGIAEGIGYSGAIRLGSSAQTGNVAIGPRRFCVDESAGLGWRCLLWRDFDQDKAVLAWLVRDGRYDGSYSELHRPDPHFDSPESLPPWAISSLPDTWPEDHPMGPNGQRSYARDLAIGWPLLALSMDGETSSFIEYHGGREFTNRPARIMRVLAWRPIPLGLFANTLFWSACLAAPFASFRLLKHTLRRRRRACLRCGYDLGGLAGGGGVCPECGAAWRAKNAL